VNALSNNEEPLEGERGVSTAAAAICFAISLVLAVLAIVVVEDVAVWIRALFVLAAGFFGWLLFFAPSRVRVAVVRWLPWC
jgi:hypothetical protein